MQTNDFKAFCCLMQDIHQKAFCEPLGLLNYGKSKVLSWYIFESTGEMLSYKSLVSYARATLQGLPNNINPSEATMGILTRYYAGTEPIASHLKPGLRAWYQYRSEKIAGLRYEK